MHCVNHRIRTQCRILPPMAKLRNPKDPALVLYLPFLLLLEVENVIRLVAGKEITK